jgi:allophycocyanin-B
MSLVKAVIETADHEVRYPTAGEIWMIQNFCKSGEQRIQIANKLARNERYLVERGSERFWQRCPVTPSNSGNIRKTNSCQRDQGWYIRLVAYCVLAGNQQPLEDIGTIGMKEMYRSLNIPIANWAEAMRCIKEEVIALLGEVDASVVTPYFDHIIDTFSQGI